MEISAINNRYNVAAKSQYDTIYPNNTAATYPAYMEEEQPKSSNMLGLTALGILAVAGIGYGIYKHRDVSSLTKKLAEKTSALEEATTKLTAADEKVKTAEKALEKANETINELKNPSKKAKKAFWSRLKFWKNWGKKSKKA